MRPTVSRSRRRGGGSAPSATVLFADDFSSGNFTNTQNGITWDPRFWVAVVDLPSIAHNGNSKMVKFRFGDSGTQSIAELRWGGASNQQELFWEYFIYIPSGAESPSVGSWPTSYPKSDNDKFFRCYQGDGTNSLSSVGASTWNGSLGIEFRYNTGTTLFGLGEGGTAASPDNREPDGFLFDAAYRGRWVRMRIRVKTATVANNDGVIQIWIDDTLVHDRTDLPNYAYNYTTMTAGDWFNGGYLFGALDTYLNVGPPAGSAIYMTDFTLSTGGFL